MGYRKQALLGHGSGEGKETGKAWLLLSPHHTPRTACLQATLGQELSTLCVTISGSFEA